MIIRDDCGSCGSCRDKPKFGGRGVLKKACQQRVCQCKHPSQDDHDGQDDHDSQDDHDGQDDHDCHIGKIHTLNDASFAICINGTMT